MQQTTNKQLISPYSKIKVEWCDRPENYSKEAKNKVRNFFAKKYGVNSNNVIVSYRPVKINEKGDMIDISGAGIDNIMDVSYQRSLMKILIERSGKIVDFDRIIALDNKINGELNVDLTASQHRSWSVKWMMIDNFLSFGENNYAPLSNMKGLTVVNSMPENQGGKTSFTIDAFKFLLHGSTTKTEVNSETFNAYSKKNDLVVRGMLEIDGEEVIIERKMKRSSKKNGEWSVTNKVSFYELLPDGEEKELSEEDAKKTTKKIKETIGSEKDFEMLVLANAKNLDDLIGLTSGESGKVLTRLIGLEILELKEAAVRKLYNEFNGKKKSNDYDVITLNSDIQEHETKINVFSKTIGELTEKLEETRNEIIKLNLKNDELISSKKKIDVVISELNPSNLKLDIEKLTATGVSLKENVEKIDIRINEIGSVIFDEDRHHFITKELSSLISSVAVKEAELKRLKLIIKELIDGGICQSCNRKLDNIDNSAHILKHEKDISKLTEEIKEVNENINTIKLELLSLNSIKQLIDEKNRLELDKDRAEVEMTSLRNKIFLKRGDLEKYNANLDGIEFNKKIDSEISMVKTNLIVLDKTKENIMSSIQRMDSDIINNKEQIDIKTKLIETIKKEDEIEKIFKIYIELVGKNGISKLVLRSVLPIINSELQRLLEDVCDFDVEIFIDDKNEVQFLLIKDEVSKKLKSASGYEQTVSSLALRGVLGKVSTLPMPNFITFDEVLGKVASINLDKIKPLFDKIKNMYDIVFLITHNDSVKDFGDNVITVVKTNNISSLKMS